jgi:hypothetical protein
MFCTYKGEEAATVRISTKIKMNETNTFTAYTLNNEFNGRAINALSSP